jgi:hypothetical protein
MWKKDVTHIQNPSVHQGDKGWGHTVGAYELVIVNLGDGLEEIGGGGGGFYNSTTLNEIVHAQRHQDD